MGIAIAEATPRSGNRFVARGYG